MATFKDSSISNTLKYGKQYGVTYSRKEVFFRLISNQTKALKEIPETKGVVSKRSDKHKLALAKILAKRLAKRFKFIKMIGVTGSVAAGYPKKEDDIDLMVITGINRLWIYRLGIRIWIWLNKIPHRKYDREQNPDEFCFNLWLETDSLSLPRPKQNLKNAMDLILMKPVINREKTYEKFIEANSWAAKYVANGYRKIQSKRVRNKKDKFCLICYLANRLAFYGQYWYMRGKFKGELVDIKRAFFHPEK